MNLFLLTPDFLENDLYSPPVKDIVKNPKEQKEEQEKTKEKALDVLEGNIKDNFIIYIKIIFDYFI